MMKIEKILIPKEFFLDENETAETLENRINPEFRKLLFFRGI